MIPNGGTPIGVAWYFAWDTLPEPSWVHSGWHAPCLEGRSQMTCTLTGSQLGGHSGRMYVHATMPGMNTGGKFVSPIVWYDPCPINDSILDMPEMRELMAEVWRRSNPDSAPPLRVERAAYLVQDTLLGEFSWVWVNDPNATPCGTGAMPSIRPPDIRWVAFVHTHPFRDGDTLPAAECDIPEGYVYTITRWGGPSPLDLSTAESLYTNNVSGVYIMDMDYFFFVPPGTTPGNSRSNVKRIPRKAGHGCPLLPRS